MRLLRRTEVRRTDPWPLHHRTVERYLIEDEKVVVATRRHWSQQLPWFAAVIAGFFLILSVSYSLPEREAGVADILWWPWFALLGWFGWKMLNWSLEWFVCTNKRLVLTYGVITHKVAMLPMRKVTDMSYHRTPLGQFLGYGTFVMESAGQVQAMSVVKWVPHPDETYLKICSVLFGEEPKPPASSEPVPHDPAVDDDDVLLPAEEDGTHVRPIHLTGPRPRRRREDTLPDVRGDQPSEQPPVAEGPDPWSDDAGRLVLDGEESWSVSREDSSGYQPVPARPRAPRRPSPADDADAPAPSGREDAATGRRAGPGTGRDPGSA